MDVYGMVEFRSQLSLEELSKIISQKICGGIKFGGSDENIFDEVPGVFTLSSFLGMRLTLGGENGKFGIAVVRWGDMPLTEGKQKNGQLDISEHLYDMISRIDGINPLVPNS